MCGIVGFFDKKQKLASGKQVIHDMTETLSRRGPDQHGWWASEREGLYFGHRRLSIIDLSQAGRQPIHSNDDSNSFVFNGEIYNHLEIRKELICAFDIDFKGTSDSEVLYYCLVKWGLEKTLFKVRGMFAFCFFCRSEKKLYLARDRAGEKPLYYGNFGGLWGFASELKALTAHPGFEKNIDKKALDSFFKYGNVPAPLSIWKGIEKLKPGSYIVYDLNKKTASAQLKYWDALNIRRSTSRCYESHVESKLHNELIAAVDEQLIADVPVGAFLSGGIDSSLVVSLAKSELNKEIKTFSIGFEDKNVDESKFARQVADHLGTRHSEWIIGPKDAQDVIPMLPKIYDEPFGDASAIPSFLVAQFAKKEVSVALTGDGADELFGGYSRYHNKKLEFCWLLWRALGQNWSRTFLSKLVGGEKLSLMLAAKDFQGFYALYISHWITSPLKEELDIVERDGVASDGTLLMQMMRSDFDQYLPDCILTKVDRSTMANSLESRVPFLDNRVLDTSFHINQKMLKEGKQGKIVLRKILARYLPINLIDRPKKGFSIPLVQWLVDDLRAMSEHYLCRESLERSGMLDSDAIIATWDRLKAGEAQYQYPIWLVLMFQIWFEEHG